MGSIGNEGGVRSGSYVQSFQKNKIGDKTRHITLLYIRNIPEAGMFSTKDVKPYKSPYYNPYQEIS